MENNSVTENLEIKPETRKNLNSIRKWSMFLSIFGFITLGTLLITGIIATVFVSVFNTSQSGFPQWAIIAIFFSVAVIAFFPVLYLFRFSKQMAHAVKSPDQQALDKAFRNLKSYFVYIGIVVILTLATYILIFIIAGASVDLFNSN